ncbi:MAG: Plug and carboxypeptidase regulatory-like domain-containing protein, partial [Saprospiraceae bacterium]|nr:Plug and carboxypeptidase regulatory-like domain-containing protein [Saprospiraceae bacterium]
TQITYAQSTGTDESPEMTQIIYGRVVDDLSSAPIEGVEIELMNYLPRKSTKTDVDGYFKLEGVPLGKHRILVTHDFFNHIIVPEIHVSSGKQVQLGDIKLEELFADLTEEVVVKAKVPKTTKDKPNNTMVLVGIRSFTIEEVRRYSGARNDPSRLIANFAGVHIGNDFENAIVIRGNSPLNVLWQLEGMPIPNPNHFSLAGYVNGLLPMINTNLMRNSDFLNGAFPSQYGNVTGGIFDIGLRSGNYNRYEGMFQLGYTGAEIGFEGPLSRRSKTSFIFAYRYSIYDILNLVGVDYGTTLIPNNQDLSFKFDFGTSNFGKVSLFGIAGTGDIEIGTGQLDSTDFVNLIARNVSFRKQLAVVGINHQKEFSSSTYLRTTIGASVDREIYEEDTLTASNQRDIVLDNSNQTVQATLSSYLNHKFGYVHSLRIGLISSYYRLNSMFRDDLFETAKRDFVGNTLLSQFYIQHLSRIGRNLKMNVGVNTQHLLLNNSYGVGPRFSLSWEPFYSHRIGLGYGWHHQIQPLRVYFNQTLDDNNNWIDANKHLKFTEAHHAVLSYDWAIVDNLRFKFEGYFQWYNKVPVTTYASSFSAINMGQEYELLNLVDLENEGFARNFGIELTLEKFFSNTYYGLLSASFVDSKYQGSDQVWRYTPYNNSVVINGLVGKVFKIGKRRYNSISIDMNFVYATGNYYTPIDLEASNQFGYEVREWSGAYALQGRDYWRLDLKIGAYFNNRKKNLSHRVFLDLINVTNHENILVQQYNAATQSIEEAQQLGFFPDLTYRLTFGIKPKSTAVWKNKKSK